MLAAHMYNGNWYMLAGAGAFSTGVTVSSGLTYNGMPGHLVTITSAGEYNFLIARNFTYGYIGASDSQVEGTFRWMTGPENGTVVSPTFWNIGEPNNSGLIEDCVEVVNGKWNDNQCSLVRNWIIEFECRPSALTNVSCPSKIMIRKT
jgi:hypothetical protein